METRFYLTSSSQVEGQHSIGTVLCWVFYERRADVAFAEAAVARPVNLNYRLDL